MTTPLPALDTPLLPQKSDCSTPGITWIRLCFLLKTYLPHSQHCLDTPLLPPKSDSAPPRITWIRLCLLRKMYLLAPSIAWMRLCCITVNLSNYCRHCMNLPLDHYKSVSAPLLVSSGYASALPSSSPLPPSTFDVSNINVHGNLHSRSFTLIFAESECACECPFKVIYIDIRLQSECQCAYQYQRECPSKVIDIRLNMNVNVNVNINVNVHIM